MADATPATGTRGKTLPWLLLLTALLVALESYSGQMLGRLGLAVHDSAHGPYFFIVALVLDRLFATLPRFQAAPTRSRVALLVLALVLLALATEAFQLWTPRNASLSDVETNLLGAAAGLSWILASGRLAGPGRRPGRRGAFWGRLAALLLLTWSVAPALTALAAHAARAHQAPALFAPGRPFARYFLTAMGTDVEMLRANGEEPRARVRFLDRNWPALAIDPVPDWRGYRNLVLEVSLSGEPPLDLHLRVHDVPHNQEYTDRFNTTLPLSPGHNRLVIPLAEIRQGPATRELDLARVQRIVIFARREDKGREIELGSVSLE